MEKILQNLWKISLVLELLCCFRIAGEISFFRPLSWGALFHRENTVMNPQNTKCHRSSKIIFFRHFWYFSVTKAIHTYVLFTKAEVNKLAMTFIWRENTYGYLSVDTICSEERTVFRKRHSRKTVSLERQILYENL